MSEATSVSGYKETSLRKAFDDGEIAGVKLVQSNGQAARFFEERALMSWVDTRPQGARKRRAAAQRTSAHEPVQQVTGNHPTPPDEAAPGPTAPSGDASTKAQELGGQVTERLEELQIENEGQAAAIDLLLDALVHESASRHEQVARVVQTYRTTEAARPARRPLEELLADLSRLRK